MKHIEEQIAAIVALVILTGCAVGPNYNPPQTSVAASFANAPTNTAAADETALATWWNGFGDATLSDLVAQAIAHNHNLRIATANLKEARALRRLAIFDLAPTVQANAGYTDSLLSKAAAVPGTPRNLRQNELYDASFDATWELDLFGRVRRSVQAATADVGSVEATRQDVLVSLTAEIARNYFELRGEQNQLAVARKNADVQTKTLEITQSLLEGGRGTDFDVSRSRALVNLTLSTIPPLEAAIQKAIYRLTVLTGRQPHALPTELSTPGSLPAAMPALALGDPEALLRRRPDIRAAERSLAGATARIGIATADLFPRVTFVGSVGLQASTFAGLGKGGADTWTFGPQLTWAALDLGRVHARIKAADARAEASLASYELTVITALEETEDALVDFEREQIRQRFLEASAQASQQASDLAHQRYEAGASDFLSVLDAERSLLEAQDRLAASQTQTATSLVAVYKALGGGWEIATSINRSNGK
ncbi:MAG TPA: efflux transporter outer membrane subunit [Verrucomicrobiae bacterium]|nr:efflux transporter outer membrane subunit [Verrucomicrobiae bacterium]